MASNTVATDETTMMMTLPSVLLSGYSKQHHKVYYLIISGQNRTGDSIKAAPAGLLNTLKAHCLHHTSYAVSCQCSLSFATYIQPTTFVNSTSVH